MAVKKPNYVSHVSNIKCGSLKEIKISYFSLNQFELIPNQAGWYCWFFVPEESECTEALETKLELLKQRKLSANIKGTLGLAYEGILQTVSVSKFSNKKISDFNYLQATMFAFAPPLYVGLSKNLKTRLNRHKYQLEKQVPFYGSSDNEDAGKNIPLDTEEESSYFAKRIAKYMNDFGVNKGELYVKCCFSDNKENLFNIELILNNTFSPIYGRR